MDAYFNYMNENGGVHGRQIKLVAYDDQYQPAKDIYVQKGIPVLVAGTGATEFVNPPIENWFGSSWLNYEV
jgi:branched-chain amino acid transport system substrate-binding protein